MPIEVALSVRTCAVSWTTEMRALGVAADEGCTKSSAQQGLLRSHCEAGLAQAWLEAGCGIRGIRSRAWRLRSRRHSQTENGIGSRVAWACPPAGQRQRGPLHHIEVGSPEQITDHCRRVG